MAHIMPRGVPASGKRRPRTPRATSSVPFSTADVALGDDGSADVEEQAGVHPVEPVVAVNPELSPEQEEIKRLRDMLAQERGKKDGDLEYESEVPPDGETIRIHFLEDGMTAQGRLWYRGEELEFVVGSRSYQETFDRFGWSWLALRGDDFAQVQRWGTVKFREGPWPGKTYADGEYENLKSLTGESGVGLPSVEELAKAEKARQQRTAPRLPTVV